MHTKISVQLVDDHELVRTGFRYVLESDPSIHIIAESSNGKSAISDFVRTSPDIVLLDISMQQMSGLSVMQHILTRHADTKIIMISMLGHEAAIRAIDGGAKGYLSKHAAAVELLQAVHAVMAGECYIDHETAQQIALAQMQGSKDLLQCLSPREYEIFVHLANAVSINTIAEMCFLSPKTTVRSHKAHIMQKLHLKNTVDFVRYAIKAKVIDGALD